MKRTIPQLIALIVLASCAHRFQYNAFRERVDQVEARNLEEVRGDTEEILLAHPEIDANTKEVLRAMINRHLETHAQLREEESKVIHVLLEETLRPQENKKQGQIIHLGNEDLVRIYQNKAANIAALVEGIKKSTAQLPGRERLFREMEYLIREIR
jgi:hypothetical protein